jgi:sporulation protein YlmC with PRC-barrel domain
MITAVVLIEVLMGKNITTPEGISLGTVTDIKLDFIQDKIWIVVKNQGRWSIC